MGRAEGREGKITAHVLIVQSGALTRLMPEEVVQDDGHK